MASSLQMIGNTALFASLDPCGSLARLVAARPVLNYRVL